MQFRVFVSSPPRWRALWASAEIMAAAIAAHAWSEQAIPNFWWLLGAGSLVYGATVTLWSGRMGLWQSLVVLSAWQTVLHVMLEVSTHVGTGHLLSLDHWTWKVAVSHALCALATLAVWLVRRSVAESRLVALPLAHVPSWRALPVWELLVTGPGRLPLSDGWTRGPPSYALAA